MNPKPEEKTEETKKPDEPKKDESKKEEPKADAEKAKPKEEDKSEDKKPDEKPKADSTESKDDKPAADKDALAQTLVDVSRMAAALGDRLKEMDINPVFVAPKGQGVAAADALVVSAARSWVSSALVWLAVKPGVCVAVSTAACAVVKAVT